MKKATGCVGPSVLQRELQSRLPPPHSHIHAAKHFILYDILLSNRHNIAVPQSVREQQLTDRHLNVFHYCVNTCSLPNTIKTNAVTPTVIYQVDGGHKSVPYNELFQNKQTHDWTGVCDYWQTHNLNLPARSLLAGMMASKRRWELFAASHEPRADVTGARAKAERGQEFQCGMLSEEEGSRARKVWACI